MNNTSFMTLGDASRATGKSKTTISKYIKNGKLSVISKDDNSYQIDPSELFRVFPPAQSTSQPTGQSLTPKITGITIEDYTDLKVQIEILKTKLDAETKRANELQTEKEDWKKQAQTLLLQAPQKPTEARKGFLARLISKDN